MRPEVGSQWVAADGSGARIEIVAVVDGRITWNLVADPDATVGGSTAETEFAERFVPGEVRGRLTVTLPGPTQDKG